MIKKIKNIIAFVAVLTLLNSCFPEDSPISPKSKLGLSQGIAVIDKFYSTQSWFNLFSDSTLAQSKLTEWDLGFECDKFGYHIILNYAKIMSAATVADKTFEEVISKEDLNFKYERPEGNMDSTAFGDWWIKNGNSIASKNLVYVVNRGINEKSRQLGYKKVQVISYNNDTYVIRVADLDGRNNDTLEVPKNPLLNYQIVSFESPISIKNIEPLSTDWQIHFTRYTHFFDVSGFEIYSVVGVFINPRYVSATVDSLSKFEDIKLQDIPKYNFIKDRNVIGYEWKFYKFDVESFTVDTKKTYLIKVEDLYPETKYFKLRFIDFYKNINGKLEKGYPKFEYTQL